MHSQSTPTRILLALLLATLLPALSGTVRAQSGATGSIQGRVFNAGNGQYVERARLTIDGTLLETFSNAGGEFAFYNVPPGNVTVRAYYTGLAIRTETVAVAAGQTARRDFTLESALDRARVDPGTVKLDAFVVKTSKEMDSAALAINEQRFARNIKTVVAANEFGSVVENDPGEVMKFIPGVTMDYNGGEARRISMDGVSSDYVPVTMGGFAIANTNQSATNRAAALDQVSLNNISRIEVNQTPTPETSGAALAGSVNFVPRSAFERAKPLLTFSTALALRDNARSLGRTAGARGTRVQKTRPSLDFAYVVPVNASFGFSVSASYNESFSPRDFMTNTWRGAGAATNGGTLPDTTPDQPYLSDYLYRDGMLDRHRSSLGFALDYKLSRTNQVTLSFQRTTFASYFDNRLMTFSVGRVLAGSFSTSHTNGFAGAGEVRITNQTRSRHAATDMPTLTFRHAGPVWTAQAGAGYSQSLDGYSDVDKGYFSQTVSRRSGVTVSFADITKLRPGRISITDGTTGAAIDPYNLGNYSLTDPQSQVFRSQDMQRSAYANLARDFKWARATGAIKGGLEISNSLRDIRSDPLITTYVGADGRVSTTPIGNDDTAAPFFDSSVANRSAPYGFAATPVPSHTQLREFYLNNRARFVDNGFLTYANAFLLSRVAEEVVSSGYIRGDLALLNQRLRFVGGIRAEQTNVRAEGPLSDPSRNYQHDAAGNIIRGPNGRALLIVPATDQLGQARLINIDRGARANKEYLRWFPSLNASFDVRENLIARVGYYESIGRPDLLQYTGGLTLPNTDNPNATIRTITVNNAGIKPWAARTVKLSLEYYFPGVGVLSSSAFRREIKNFFGSIIFPVTPEFLATYDLDPDTWGNDQVSTQYNIRETVRMDGVNVNYKQALTFLPDWARGFQVFANGNLQRATGGNATANFNFSPKFGSCGVRFTRGKYDLRANWNYRGRQRLGAITGRGIAPDTYNWAVSRTYLDLMADYTLGRHFTVFAKFRNVADVTEDFEIANAGTPAVARFRQREDFAGLWTFGLRGSF